ncbi:NlpC/P60 family protein [Thiofilum flexile]|uniref:NlpC/P60 family protein n=1 Tax=Thiofilum flexile TaxID=125627 RepID=UPI00036F4C36|nr:NlpC/P60 family protein [Thiofilum flexile]
MKNSNLINSLPAYFWNTPYNAKHHPQAEGVKGVEGGANCQQFAYEVLRFYGLNPPNLRSSELWEDNTLMTVADLSALQPLDLLLWNDTAKAYGAHVGVYVGEGQALHLSKANHYPKVETLSHLETLPEYQVWIGAKRVGVI